MSECDSKRRWFGLGTMLVVVSVLPCTSSTSRASEPEPQSRVIGYEEVPGLQIIGKLGHPIGELLNVRGRWGRARKQSKPSAPVFIVTHLDSKPLASPVEFTTMTAIGRSTGGFTAPKLNATLPDVVWELRGHEFATGEFGYSEKAQQEAGNPPLSRAPSFQIEFKFVTAREYRPPMPVRRGATE